MSKVMWEYKNINTSELKNEWDDSQFDEKLLNKKGKNGWELVAINLGTAIFKRIIYVE